MNHLIWLVKYYIISALMREKVTFKMADQATVSCRSICLSRRSVISYRSIDKVQSIILKDFEEGDNQENF